MSLEGMHGAWASLDEEAVRFREISGQQLSAGQAFDQMPEDLIAVADGLLEASERIRREGDSAIREGEDYEEVSTLLLAAAAVDALFARDLFVLEPGLDHEQIAALFASEGEEEDFGAAFEEGDELLEEVRRLFGGAAQPASLGRSPFPDRQALVGEIEDATERLLGLAVGPATTLAEGLVRVAAAATGELLTAALHLDVVTELERKAEKLKTRGPRFLREHVAKIVTLRSDERIVDEVADKAGEEIEKRAAIPVAFVLRFLAAPQFAAAHAEQRISHAPEVSQEQGDALLASLADLDKVYREQMHWIGKSAGWLKRGSRFLVHLGAVAIGPASYAIGAGVFFVGFAYVGYSLADRVDARDLGVADRVEGVVRLVDRHIPPTARPPVPPREGTA